MLIKTGDIKNVLGYVHLFLNFWLDAHLPNARKELYVTYILLVINKVLLSDILKDT